jgi:hypothetical protein
LLIFIPLLPHIHLLVVRKPCSRSTVSHPLLRFVLRLSSTPYFTASGRKIIGK